MKRIQMLRERVQLQSQLRRNRAKWRAVVVDEEKQEEEEERMMRRMKRLLMKEKEGGMKELSQKEQKRKWL